MEHLIHLENAQHGAKSVTNVAIKIILALNVGPNSQEEGIEDPAAHPEGARAKVSISSPGLEATRQPKVHTAWSQPPFKTIQTSMEKKTDNLHGESADLHGQRGDLHGTPNGTKFLKQSFSTISRSKSVASISNDTDPEGKTKIPHHVAA